MLLSRSTRSTLFTPWKDSFRSSGASIGFVLTLVCARATSGTAPTSRHPTAARRDQPVSWKRIAGSIEARGGPSGAGTNGVVGSSGIRVYGGLEGGRGTAKGAP